MEHQGQGGDEWGKYSAAEQVGKVNWGVLKWTAHSLLLSVMWPLFKRFQKSRFIGEISRCLPRLKTKSNGVQNDIGIFTV